MSKWKQIRILNQNVIYENGKSVLIAMPHKSDYDGYKFWHPVKIVEDDIGSILISYTDEFVFRLFKNGNGKYNQREIIDRIEITSADMEEAFNHYHKLSEYERHVPEKLEPQSMQVSEELLDG